MQCTWLCNSVTQWFNMLFYPQNLLSLVLLLPHGTFAIIRIQAILFDIIILSANVCYGREPWVRQLQSLEACLAESEGWSQHRSLAWPWGVDGQQRAGQWQGQPRFHKLGRQKFNGWSRRGEKKKWQITSPQNNTGYHNTFLAAPSNLLPATSDQEERPARQKIRTSPKNRSGSKPRRYGGRVACGRVAWYKHRMCIDNS